MTAILWALVATLAPTLVVCFWRMHKMWLHDRERECFVDLLLEQRDQDSALIAELQHDVEMAQTGEMVAQDKLTRVTAERDQAIKQGGLAAKAAMTAAARERDEFIESLQAWQFNCAALALATRMPAAIEAAPRTPKSPLPLPSGDFLTADGDGPLILQVDDLEVPAGARGTGA